jgi:cytochrome oxidase Cu insertion factor (SCO1/SenC/PrrC family)
MNRIRYLLVLPLLLGPATNAVEAHQDHKVEQAPAIIESKATPPSAASETRAREYFTDLPVIAQDGSKLRFYTDVLKDRIVLISLFYTKCPEACPLTAQKLAEVQAVLGEDLGDRIYLISVSVDPKNDTPEAVRQYAEKFRARDGWLFLTGEHEDMQMITYRLGQIAPEIEGHNTQFMIGNVNREHWARVAPYLPAEFIAGRLRLLASDENVE